jgi:hypothetical protein
MAGDTDAAGDRTSPACKVAYPNRDTYFGPYAAGAKAGTGLYVAATGAGYVGQYAAGKRSGFGLMILPDGGLYKGGFREDKFEGQVRRRSSGFVLLVPDQMLFDDCVSGGNGAGYVGQYAAGKRSGFGLMILPDGGLYKGGFKVDNGR